MKITSAQQNLSSSHFELEQRQVSERLRTWSGQRPPRADDDNRNGRSNGVPNDSAPTRISSLARALAQAAASAPPAPSPQRPTETAESSAIDDSMKNADQDPSLAILRGILERLFGITIKTFDAAELRGETSSDLEESQRLAASGGNGAWGVEYDYSEQRTEIETTSFEAEGIVKTQDGQTFQFKLSLEMTRSFSERIEISYRAGQAAQQKDPLLFNFAGTAAQLSDQRFEIDLDNDGKSENARFAAAGSGFLVFDKNGDGKINNGKEMFGPSSGDGFAELAAHDSDQNGWIDENDPIFAQLRVWTKTADGTDVLKSLQASDVGAISLARLATPFAIKDTANTQLGQVRSSSVYLSDSGRVGSVQQIDLSV